MNTYYYPRPTHQDVLIEERYWNQTNNSHSGLEIFEWNLDGLTDRHLTILVHRMLMYATTCMALVRNREDVVYTLVLTILEHFNSRFTNQHETVRTLLNDLRCQTLGHFRLYKDTFLRTCTQEGLNLCNELHMARQLKTDKLRETSQLGVFCAKFGLRDPSGKSSNKDRYYKSSSTEGSHRKRRSRRRSKEEREARKSSRKSHIFTKYRSGRDLSKVKCYKCGQLGHIAPNCKLNKLKTLELDGETYEKVYGLLYTSGPNYDYDFDSGSDIELLDLFDNDKICDNPCTTCQGNTCNCEDDEIYKLQSQFQDFNMNTITSDNVIEFLKEVTDSKLREKIINSTTSSEASSSSSKPFENKKNDLNDFEYSTPYS
ncbi:hypothetical protein H5410_041028 [Solanum commersonii]|uniref:CCHC-type domain-containing protein n=1 Tax=Solanum commersonii TaxID=4109 RepID=A0A9J5XRV0_SOLCO|nr:hypothetical protein H5410_041028 [Solanum commersonii]